MSVHAKGLDHVAIVVRDLEESIRLWRDALGLELEAVEEVLLAWRCHSRTRTHFRDLLHQSQASCRSYVGTLILSYFASLHLSNSWESCTLEGFALVLMSNSKSSVVLNMRDFIGLY